MHTRLLAPAKHEWCGSTLAGAACLVRPARRAPPPNQQHKDARAARDEQRSGSCALDSWRRQHTSGAVCVCVCAHTHTSKAITSNRSKTLFRGQARQFQSKDVIRTDWNRTNEYNAMINLFYSNAAAGSAERTIGSHFAYHTDPQGN